MRFGIIGTGAIGAYYGAKLAKAGEEVHFLFHSDYDYVKMHGLQINSVNGNFHLNDLQVYHRVEDMPKCDIVIVALKSTNQKLLKNLLLPLLKQDTWVLLIQNGIGLEEDFSNEFPQIGVLAGLAYICSTKTGPGVVNHSDLGRLNIGNYNCYDSVRLQALADIMNHAGIDTKLVHHDEARWQKAVWNMCFNGLTVVLNTTVDKLVNCTSTISLCHSLMIETIEAAQACGVTSLDKQYVDRMLEMTMKMKPYSPSMKVDFDHHRPMEIHYLYTRPIEEAIKFGYEMKKLKMLEEQLKFIEQSYLKVE